MSYPLCHLPRQHFLYHGGNILPGMETILGDGASWTDEYGHNDQTGGEGNMKSLHLSKNGRDFLPKAIEQLRKKDASVGLSFRGVVLIAEGGYVEGHPVYGPTPGSSDDIWMVLNPERSDPGLLRIPAEPYEEQVPILWAPDMRLEWDYIDAFSEEERAYVQGGFHEWSSAGSTFISAETVLEPLRDRFYAGIESTIGLGNQGVIPIEVYIRTAMQDPYGGLLIHDRETPHAGYWYHPVTREWGKRICGIHAASTGFYNSIDEEE